MIGWKRKARISNTFTEGAGWIVGSYIVGALTDNLHFDCRITWGKNQIRYNGVSTGVIGQAVELGALMFGSIFSYPITLENALEVAP